MKPSHHSHSTDKDTRLRDEAEPRESRDSPEEVTQKGGNGSHIFLSTGVIILLDVDA